MADFGAVFGKHLPDKDKRKCVGDFLMFRQFLLNKDCEFEKRAGEEMLDHSVLFWKKGNLGVPS